MTTWAPTLSWCALVVVFAAMSNVWNGHEPGWYASLARWWAPMIRCTNAGRLAGSGRCSSAG